MPGPGLFRSNLLTRFQEVPVEEILTAKCFDEASGYSEPGLKQADASITSLFTSLADFPGSSQGPLIFLQLRKPGRQGRAVQVRGDSGGAGASEQYRILSAVVQSG